MADTKISELTEATAPSATDMVPVVSGGATKKTKIQNLRPYKIYVALLTQSGSGNPAATELENTLGGTVVWTRAGTGDYRGTLAGVFTLDKTFVLVSPSGTATTDIAAVTRLSSDVMQLRTPADSHLNSNSIEIRVYP